MLYLTVCGGALLWGISNVWKSKLLRGLNVHEDVMVVGMSSGIVLFCLGFQLFWEGLTIPHVQSNFWLPFAVTAGLNILIQYWNVKALKLEDASIVVPLSATMPAWVIIASWVLLKEWPTLYGRIGISLVAVGAYILYLKGSETKLPVFIQKTFPVSWHENIRFYFNPWLRIFSSTGARYALGMAYLGAIAINFDKLSTLASNPMIFEAGAFAVAGSSVYLWSKASGRWNGISKEHIGKVFVIGLIMGMSSILMATGFYYGIVPYVGTLKRTQILWTVILAGLLLKEKHMTLKIVGASIIFVGSLLLAF